MQPPSAFTPAGDFCLIWLPYVPPIHFRATVSQEIPLSEDSWLFFFFLGGGGGPYYNKQQADLFWDAAVW